jgi:hypothetical protein
MSGALFPTIRVDEWTLRRIFNELDVEARVISGELTRVIKRSKPVPSSAGIANWIQGTLSQEVYYYDRDGNRVGKTHRYLRPDGSLAASGLEDPKRFLKDGTIHILDLAL